MSEPSIEQVRELVAEWEAFNEKDSTAECPDDLFIAAPDLARLVLTQAEELARLRGTQRLDFVTALKIARSGLTAWAGQSGNRKWWKRIDGTPIPNDLMVFVAEQFVARATLTSAQEPQESAST